MFKALADLGEIAGAMAKLYKGGRSMGHGVASSVGLVGQAVHESKIMYGPKMTGAGFGAMYGAAGGMVSNVTSGDFTSIGGVMKGAAIGAVIGAAHRPIAGYMSTALRKGGMPHAADNFATYAAASGPHHKAMIGSAAFGGFVGSSPINRNKRA